MRAPSPEIRARSRPAARRRRWLWVGIGALLAALAIAALPLYREAKLRRARSLAAEAESLMQRQQWQESANKAQAAFSLGPEEPAALRVMARLNLRAGAATAIAFWKKLLAQPGSTRQDRREAAQAALVFDVLDFAEEQIEALRSGGAEEAEDLDLAVQLALKKGDRTGALDLAARLLTLAPERQGTRLLHAQLQVTSPDPAEETAGRDALLALSRNRDSAGLRALELLAGDPTLPAEQAREVAAALESHPLSAPRQQLLAITIQQRLAPEKRAELIAAACERFRATGPDGLLALGRWLLRQDEPARAAELIPLPTALTRQDLFLVRLDALSALGRWEEIQETLNAGKVPLEPFYTEVFLARAARELGSRRDAALHWSSALTAAKNKPHLLFYLAQYAEKTGEPDATEKAWRELARLPAWALRANLALVPLLDARQDTRGLREVMRLLIRLLPKDSAPRNDAAYLDLLLQENLAGALATAQQLVRESPQLLAHRTTLALAYLRAERPAEALAVYEGLQIDWLTALPAARAVYLAVLAANDQPTPVNELLPPEALATLKPPERALLPKAK